MQNLNKITLEIKDPSLKTKYFDIMSVSLFKCLLWITLFKCIRVIYVTIAVSIFPFIEDEKESNIYILQEWIVLAIQTGVTLL